MYRLLLVGVLVCAVVGVGLPPVSAHGSEELVTGRPNLDLTLTDNRIGPSEAGSLDITVTNSAEIRNSGPDPFVERVKTARNVRLTVIEERLDVPIEIQTATVVVGTVPDGRPATATVAYESGGDIAPGAYRIPVRLEYEYTFAVGYDRIDRVPGYTDVNYVDATRTEVEYVTVVVPDRSRFDVTSETTTLFAGDTGSVTLTLRNTGTEPATDARLRLDSASPAVFFGRAAAPRDSTTVLVPTLAPGESRTVRVEVGVRSEATAGRYPVEARVIYDNANGVRTSSEPFTVEIQTSAERRFSVRNVEPTSLRVGADDVVVTGTVVNLGPGTARNAVVTMAIAPTAATGTPESDAGAATTSSGRLQVTDTEAAVGDLTPGVSRPVQFKLAVPRDVEPGTRTLTFVVEYENDEGELRTSRLPMRRAVELEPEVEQFDVEGVQTNVSIDATNRLVLSVRNTGSVTYRDVTVQIDPRPPFSSVSPEAYVESLSPGDTATFEYELTVDNDAVPSTQGLRVTVVAEEPDGDTYRSRTEQVPVEIRDRRLLERDGVSVLIGAVVVGAVLLVASLVTNRS